MIVLLYNVYKRWWIMSFNDKLRENADKKSSLIAEKSLELRSITKGISGYVSYFRKALGMSAKQLGERVGKSSSTILDLEKRELDGSVTIKNLKAVADALDCDFYYTFVPRTNISRQVELRAKEKALEELKRIRVNMELEGENGKFVEDELKALMNEFKHSRKLWD